MGSGSEENGEDPVRNVSRQGTALPTQPQARRSQIRLDLAMDLSMFDLHAGLATLQRIVMFPLFLHVHMKMGSVVLCG
jgi:hypothetical protein